jgi:endonuclease/exonuclease/phosphatase family metal-dependent hydrolase
VLVWNLFHGRAQPGAGRDLRGEFAARLRDWERDLALLQEVPPWWPPFLAAELGVEQRTALTSRNAVPALRRALAERWPDLVKSNGGGANAILARVPLRAHRALRLRRWPERRVLQLVRLENGVCAANLHASTRPRLARDELERAFALALDWADGAPLIFGGDLNLRDPHPPAPGVHHAAARDVDHLFVRGLEPVGAPARPDRSLEDGGALLSDHPALMVSLRAFSP